jgi:hypothetical protein
MLSTNQFYEEHKMNFSCKKMNFSCIRQNMVTIMKWNVTRFVTFTDFSRHFLILYTKKLDK